MAPSRHKGSSSSSSSPSREEDVVILSAKRTPITNSRRGAFKRTPPSDLLAAALKGAVESAGLSPDDVEDIAVGNVLAEQAAFMARIGQMLAGFSPLVPIATVNRQCSSGLQAVMDIAGAIRVGTISLGIGSGVESMSSRPMHAIQPNINPKLFENEAARDCLLPMGITSENVAKEYQVTREEQDAFAAESHQKAADARKNGFFKAEIISTLAQQLNEDGDVEDGAIVDIDDGIREGVTTQTLAKLRPSFTPDGTTTAGNSSQTSDGAAAVVLASRKRARELGQVPLARIVHYAVVGVPPAIMGIGPAVAIPKVLKAAGLTVDDIDVFEINEAFASQIVYCVRALGIPMHKVNPLGGAIALGHPLGCTGARQVVTLVHYLRRKRLRYGVVSMCIGTGMGAAVIIENDDYAQAKAKL